MAESRYFVRSRGRISGPFDLPGLQKLVRRGQLSRSDQVSPDKVDWSSAGEFEDLFPLRGTAAMAAATTLPAGASHSGLGEPAQRIATNTPAPASGSPSMSD